MLCTFLSASCKKIYIFVYYVNQKKRKENTEKFSYNLGVAMLKNIVHLLSMYKYIEYVFKIFIAIKDDLV